MRRSALSTLFAALGLALGFILPVAAENHPSAAPNRAFVAKGSEIIPEAGRIRPGENGQLMHPRYRLFRPEGVTGLRPPSHAEALDNLRRLKLHLAPTTSTCSPGTDPGFCSHFETPASLACVYHLVPANEVAQEPGCNPSSASFNPTGGSGAIAVVLAYDNPEALSYLNTFSSHFGLPTMTSSTFEVVYSDGYEPAFNADWQVESALDTQWAHAMAPNAKLFLVEAASNGSSDLFYAAEVAASLVAENGGGVVSMSFGGSEASGETADDGVFLPTPGQNGVFFIASSGDNATPIYPSTSPNVLAAGGTSIARDSSGNFVSESAWAAGGAGTSAFESIPSFQSRVASIVGGRRGVPDLSFDADPVSGVWVYLGSACSEVEPGWCEVGGTSVSSPSLAGVLDTMLTANASVTAATDSTGLTAIYGLLGKSTYLRDITQGTCSAESAGTGYDLCTGVGVPVGTGLFTDTVPAVGGSCGAANATHTRAAPADPGLCALGDPSAIGGSGPWSWSCLGDFSGSAATCATAQPIVDGSCGSANGSLTSTAPTSGLCSAGTASALSGSGPWSWSCQGLYGGNSASCSASPPPLNGACGPANGVGTSSAPTTGLCIAGSASAVSGTGPWDWTCQGAYGGGNASCSAPLPLVNGTCGPANGVTTTTPPTSGLCTTGTASALSGSGPWGWDCQGANGGTTATCSAPAPVVTGICGPANGTPATTIPAVGLCSSGNATTVSGSGPWAWACQGSGGGASATCGTNLLGTCGTADAGMTKARPTGGLCASGTASAITGNKTNGPWSWSCTGSGGYNATCESFSIHMTNGVCGKANGKSYKVAPAAALCAVGTHSAVSGSGPWYWTCIGRFGGAVVSCSADLK